MSYTDETLSQSPRPRFDSTHWSLVIRSQHPASTDGRVALAELCQRYWYPLFAYVRQQGYDVHQAQDLTQGFFERLIDKNYVSDADPARGKFRTFLLTSLTNFLANEHDKRSALKRGGDLKQFSLEYELAERRYSIEPTTSDSPAKQFEQRWARHLLERVVQQLQQEYVDAGKADVFENLKQFLVTTDTEPATVIAQRLGMSEAAVRVAGHRLRNQYRAMVRQEIAATVGNCEEVDDEIAALFAAFTPGKKSFRERV